MRECSVYICGRVIGVVHEIAKQSASSRDIFYIRHVDSTSGHCLLLLYVAIQSVLRTNKSVPVRVPK